MRSLEDLRVPAGPDPFRNKVVYPGHEHVLVVRPVEHTDVPGRRHLAADPPQKVVPALLRGGRAEADDVHALRVELSDHVADRPVLAAAVHGLQDQQHPARVTGGFRAGVQPLLVPGELRADRADLIAGPLLVPFHRQPRGAAWVHRRQVERVSGRYP